jgi:hypothetical protein
MKLFLSFLLASFLTGCATSVTTLPYQPAAMNNGVVYALPKNLLKVMVTYTIQKKTTLAHGLVKTTTETPLLRKPIVLESVLTQDPENSFVLSGEGLVKDPRLDANFKFQVGPNQLLTGVSADLSDKSPEIIQGLVGSAISAAKLVAVAGEGEEAALKKLATRLDQIDQETVDLAAGADPKKLEKIQDLMKEQKVLLDYLNRHRELNTVKTEEREVAFSKTLDVAKLIWNKEGYWMAEIAASGATLGNFSDDVVPVITLQIQATAAQFHHATTPLALEAKGAPGIYYRVPTPLRIVATTTKGTIPVTLLDDTISFCQAGPINKVEARYKTFAKRKTTIEFSPVTGSISEYGVTSTSSAEEAAKTLDTSLGQVQHAVVDIQKAQAAAEAARKSPAQVRLAELETQKKLLETEADVIKAQQELARLK